MRLRQLAAPSALLVVVGFAAPANAAVSISGSSITSDAVGDLIRPTCTGGNLASTGTATTGDPCATLTAISISANDGADTVDLSGLTTATFPALTSVSVYLGEDFDDDTASGSPFNDSFTGNEGFDDSASGGAGDDTFNGVESAVGGLGDDVFLKAYKYAAGGPGDDRFVQFTAADGIEGGDGFDTWEADFDQSGVGGLPGNVVFTMDPTALVLSVPDLGVSQTVPINGVERFEMTLFRAASETWNGSALAASQEIRSLSGNDTVIGGPLDDELIGAVGNDALTGGAGRDRLDAGAGDDKISARDGEVDTVLCGEGTDSVVADAVDLVVSCEAVDLPAVVTPPPPPPPPVAVVPETGTITGPAKVTKPKKASFKFTSPTAGATFQCKVDAKAWKTCSSPYKVATKKLKPGKHKLLVRAVVGSAVDATPSKKVFKVRKG